MLTTIATTVRSLIWTCQDSRRLTRTPRISVHLFTVSCLANALIETVGSVVLAARSWYTLVQEDSRQRRREYYKPVSPGANIAKHIPEDTLWFLSSR